MFLHRENAEFLPLDKMGVPSSDQIGPVVALPDFILHTRTSCMLEQLLKRKKLVIS